MQEPASERLSEISSAVEEQPHFWHSLLQMPSNDHVLQAGTLRHQGCIHDMHSGEESYVHVQMNGDTVKLYQELNNFSRTEFIAQKFDRPRWSIVP